MPFYDRQLPKLHGVPALMNLCQHGNHFNGLTRPLRQVLPEGDKTQQDRLELPFGDRQGDLGEIYFCRSPYTSRGQS